MNKALLKSTAILILVVSCFSQFPKLSLRPPQPLCPCKPRIHWIFALDHSGSMGWNSPTRWSKLIEVMNDDPSGFMALLDDPLPGQLHDLVTAYTFDH